MILSMFSHLTRLRGFNGISCLPSVVVILTRKYDLVKVSRMTISEWVLIGVPSAEAQI